jgi:hypothetical protein
LANDTRQSGIAQEQLTPSFGIGRARNLPLDPPTENPEASPLTFHKQIGLLTESAEFSFFSGESLVDPTFLSQIAAAQRTSPTVGASRSSPSFSISVRPFPFFAPPENQSSLLRHFKWLAGVRAQKLRMSLTFVLMCVRSQFSLRGSNAQKTQTARIYVD